MVVVLVVLKLNMQTIVDSNLRILKWESKIVKSIKFVWFS